MQNFTMFFALLDSRFLLDVSSLLLLLPECSCATLGGSVSRLAGLDSSL